MGKIICLFKTFSKKEYAEEFLAGKLRFGKLGFYKNIEDIRSDKQEGLIASYSPTESLFSIAGIQISPEDLVGKIEYSRPHLEEEYIYCLSSIRSVNEKLIYPLVSRISEFGQYVVFIKNVSKFLELFNNKEFSVINKDAKKLEASPVCYKDFKSEHIPLGTVPEGFLKDVSYEEECEYRLKLTIPSCEEEFYYIDIGSLKDIANFVEIKDFTLTINSKETGEILERIFY